MLFLLSFFVVDLSRCATHRQDGSSLIAKIGLASQRPRSVYDSPSLEGKTRKHTHAESTLKCQEGPTMARRRHTFLSKPARTASRRYPFDFVTHRVQSPPVSKQALLYDARFSSGFSSRDPQVHPTIHEPNKKTSAANVFKTLRRFSVLALYLFQQHDKSLFPSVFFSWT